MIKATMQEPTRQELVSYYKWIVNLSIFIVTAIVTIVSSMGDLIFSDMLRIGIFFLLLSIFFNWLIIKRLTTQFIIESEQLETPLSKFFFKGEHLSAIYGFVQNWAFLIGFVLIVLSFVLGENYSGIFLDL